MRVPVFKSSRTKAAWAVEDSFFDKGSWPWTVIGMAVPLAERTDGPLVTVVLLIRNSASVEVTKVPVAPESRIQYRFVLAND